MKNDNLVVLPKRMVEVTCIVTPDQRAAFLKSGVAWELDALEGEEETSSSDNPIAIDFVKALSRAGAAAAILARVGIWTRIIIGQLIFGILLFALLKWRTVL